MGWLKTRMMLFRIVSKTKNIILFPNIGAKKNRCCMHYHSFVSINGTIIDDPENAKISIWDQSLHRGDGVFEVMKLLKSTGGIRAMEHHLQRLQTSADSVGCPLPPKDILINWLNEAADAWHDKNHLEGAREGGALRLIATKGGVGNNNKSNNNNNNNNNNNFAPPNIIISFSPLPQWPKSFTLFPLLAPWHPAGFPGWEVPIKWTSYGPNVVATRKAQQGGFTDAILLSSDRLDSIAALQKIPALEDCHVLDGPNFAIGWINKGNCYFPCSKSLGLLPSITQSLVADLASANNNNNDQSSSGLGLQVEYGIYPLREVLCAEEVFVMSTTRGVIPVTQIGNTILGSSIQTQSSFYHPSSHVVKLSKLLDSVEEG